jgi:hypothetical protein
MNASEPLITCRESCTWSQKGVSSCDPDELRGDLKCCLSDFRQTGGMTLGQALCVNVGTVNRMVSEKLQVSGPHEGESSEAGTRGGLTRRSWEGAVMALEQRGQPGT